tara:strand:- start:3186 stop:3413 length:228 start_codon:yes stop_codon:yes gene_type:complete
VVTDSEQRIDRIRDDEADRKRKKKSYQVYPWVIDCTHTGLLSKLGEKCKRYFDRSIPLPEGANEETKEETKVESF